MPQLPPIEPGTTVHADRGDSVGDLACDYRAERRVFRTSPPAMRAHLEDLGASEHALAALDRAEREWRLRRADAALPDDRPFVAKDRR